MTDKPEQMNEKLKARILNLVKDAFRDWWEAKQKQDVTVQNNIKVIMMEKGTVVGHVSGLEFSEVEDDNVICKIDITDSTFDDRLYKGQVNMDDISLGLKSEDK